MPFIQLQFRRGTATEWTSANPILADGELAIETDTSKFKIGNGVAYWNLLNYGGLVGPTGSLSNIVTFDISFNGNIFVGKDISLSGKLNVRNDVSFNTELRVGGNVNVRSGTVSTSSTTGAVIIVGGVGIGGNIYTGGNLNVAGDVKFTGGNLNISKTTVSTSSSTGALIVSGGVGVGGNLWTGGNLFIGVDSSLNGNVVVGKNLTVVGDVSFNDNMSVQSDSSFNNRLYVGRQIGVGVTANSYYALDVLGNINLSGNLFLNNKLFSITNADISLNANLIVGADASLSGNVFVSKTLNLKKTIVTGATSSSPTSLIVSTPIIELTGSGASTAYFTLLGGSYAGQTLTILSATSGGGGGLYVNPTGTNIIFNGSSCTQMRFSSSFQTVNLIWNTTTLQWIVASWQGVNFANVSMNFGTYTSGDITLGSAGKVYLNAGIGGLVVGSDSSFNGNLSVAGTDSSFNANLYIGVGKRVGIGKTAGSNYLLDVNGNINFAGNLFTNGVLFSAFDNSKDISLNAKLSVAFDSSFNSNLYIGNRLTVASDLSLNQRLTVGGADSSFNGNLYVGRKLIVNSGDVSLNQRLAVGGADSSFNGNLYVGGFVNSEGFIERFVNVVSSSGTYTANFTSGLIIYVNAFSGSSTPTLSITNLPIVANQSYVFTVVYSGVATSTYFSALNINGSSVPLNGSVSLTAATSYYVHQFYIFITDTSTLSNNFVLQSFNSSAPLGLVSPVVNGNLAVNGNINIVGGNIFQNGSIFTGSGSGSGGGSSVGNLYVGADISFGGNLFGSVDMSLNRHLFVGGDISFGGNLIVRKTTASTSATTGALIVGGGAGVTGNVYVGGNLYVTGTTAFTGIPTAPTAATSTNTTQIATTAFVRSEISALVASAPAALDTLKELGNALGNDAAFSTTVTNSLALKAPLASPTFTGTITTPALSVTNSTASTSTGTGSLIVGGGIGIGGNIYTGGNVTVTGTVSATTFNATSDYRIKHNILLLDASFNVDVLRPVSFVNSKLGKSDIGFIAHEVGEHYPYLVNGEKDGVELQTLNYTGIIGILTKEIQDLKKRVSILEGCNP